MHPAIPGTRGYADEADVLIPRYEAVAFEHKHRASLHLLPADPVEVLDIGAGTGADAAWLAARGHSVVAVEPVEAFRRAGRALHPHPLITWMHDGLPALSSVRALGRRFGLVMLTAVWMHLDPDERVAGAPALASLLAPDGLLVMSLRHGPMPAGRRMFEVSAAETVALVARCGLTCVLDVTGESSEAANRAAGILWSNLAFRPS